MDIGYQGGNVYLRLMTSENAVSLPARAHSRNVLPDAECPESTMVSAATES
jgi:hypothetical protein